MILAAQEHEEQAAARSQRRRPPVRRSAVWIPLIVVLILAIALVFGIWRHVQLKRQQQEFAAKTSQVAVQFVNVHRNKNARELILPGNIVAVHQATVYARASGYVERWYVDIGDIVKEGQLLADIATPELDQELAQGEHELQQAVANYEIAKVTAERWQQLVQKRVVSQQESDQNQANYRAAEAAVNADKSNVERLQALQGFKHVIAPFRGRITARQVDVGTLLAAGGGSPGTPLFTIAVTNPLDIFVNVPQTNVPSIHEGLAVRLLVEEYASRKFPAKVIRTAGALDPASRTLNTEVEIANDDGALYAGMYAQVKFTLTDDTTPIVIPANAFVFRTEGSQVATVTKDSKIHWQKIQMGRDFGTEMEVLSGLEDNASVVINPTDDLTESLAVQAKPADAKAAKGGGDDKTKAAKPRDDSAKKTSPTENGHPSD